MKKKCGWKLENELTIPKEERNDVEFEGGIRMKKALYLSGHLKLN